MRPLNKNERLLLCVVLGLLGFIVTSSVWSWVDGKRIGMQKANQLLQIEAARGHINMAQKALWIQRGEWIHGNQQVLQDEGKARSEFLESVSVSARDHQLLILDQQIKPSQTRKSGTALVVSLQVKGTMEAFVRWLTSVQQPDQLQGVYYLTLQSGDERGQVVARLEVQKVYTSSTNKQPVLPILR